MKNRPIEFRVRSLEMPEKFQAEPQEPVEPGRMGLKSMPMAARKRNLTNTMLQGPEMEKTKTQPINPADVVSTPTQGTRPQPGKDSTNSFDSFGKRPASRQVGQVKERPVEKLHETKRRQFRNGNTN